MNESFKVAHASASDWQETARHCLDQLGPALPAGGLGFVYVTDAFAEAFPKIHDRLREQSGVEHWIGTVGLGICAPGREYFDRPAMAVMVADLPPSSYRLFRDPKGDLGGFSNDHGAWAREKSAHFGIVHADPRHPDLQTLIPELAGAIDGFLVGGLTSSRSSLFQLAGAIGDGGISGALISGEVAVATALTQSCSPIAESHEITQCQENIAIKLDGRPALEVFKEDIGEDLAKDLGRISGTIFAALPVKGSDTGDYLVRHLVGVDPERGLIGIGERLDAGSQILFVRRDREAAGKDFVRMLEGLKRRTKGTPKGALYYSCLARGPNLFGADSEELKTIQAILGEFPLVGFFGNGEISHNRLYTYTGVLTLFV